MFALTSCTCPGSSIRSTAQQSAVQRGAARICISLYPPQASRSRQLLNRTPFQQFRSYCTTLCVSPFLPSTLCALAPAHCPARHPFGSFSPYMHAQQGPLMQHGDTCVRSLQGGKGDGQGRYLTLNVGWGRGRTEGMQGWGRRSKNKVSWLSPDGASRGRPIERDRAGVGGDGTYSGGQAYKQGRGGRWGWGWHCQRTQARHKGGGGGGGGGGGCNSAGWGRLLGVGGCIMGGIEQSQGGLETAHRLSGRSGCGARAGRGLQGRTGGRPGTGGRRIRGGGGGDARQGSGGFVGAGWMSRGATGQAAARQGAPWAGKLRGKGTKLEPKKGGVARWTGRRSGLGRSESVFRRPSGGLAAGAPPPGGCRCCGWLACRGGVAAQVSGFSRPCGLHLQAATRAQQ